MNIKKLIIITLIPLAGIAFATSCSKKSETNKKGKAREAAAKAAKAASPAENGSLAAIRDGQYTNLSWHVDNPASKIKQINIMRSPTGVSMKRKVAELQPAATSYKDCMPNEDAQWYWVHLVAVDGGVQIIGPARVGPDKAGSAHYIHPEDAYQISITRTDEIATLKWAFPDGEYKLIHVVRNTRPVAQPFKGGSTEVVSTLEGQSQYNNPLKNPNSEYWYWFRIITKSGTVVYKGPIKAEYIRSAGKSAKFP